MLRIFYKSTTFPIFCKLFFVNILRAVQGETLACSHARQSVGKRKPENPRSGERGYVSLLAVRSIINHVSKPISYRIRIL
jgi:hypothetical protein